jgi:hypothetical protein
MLFTSKVVRDCAEPVLALAWRSFQYASLFLADDAQPPSAQTASYLIIVLYSAEAGIHAALTGAAAQYARPSTRATDESSVSPTQRRYTAAVLAAPPLLACLTIMASSAHYALLLPQLPLVAAPTGVGSGSPLAAAADSTAGSSSSSSSTSTSTNKAKSRKGKSGSGTKSKSSSSGIASNTTSSSSSSSSSVSWPEGVPAWQLAYRERQKLPTLQQKLLRLFGCSSTAVLCAAAVAKGSPDFFKQRQVTACILLRKTCEAISHSFADSSTPAAAAAADCNAQQQQLYFLLPSLLLYWCAYCQSDCLVPISLARQSAVAMLILVLQQHQLLLPTELRKAAVDELPPLFSRIGQILLQPAGTNMTTPAAAAAASSSSSSAITNLCADPASATMSLDLVTCMCYMYAGVSGSIHGRDSAGISSLLTSSWHDGLSINESVGLGPQHAGGAHQLLEYAVRSKSFEAMPYLPTLLQMLLRRGSVWNEAAVAGVSASLSGHDSSSSGGGEGEYLQCISFVFSVMKCITLQFAAASAAQLAGSSAQHNAQDSDKYDVLAGASRCCSSLGAGAAGWLKHLADASTAAAAAGVAAAVPWLVLIGRVLLQAEFAAAHVQHDVYHQVLPVLRGYLKAQRVAKHMAAAGLDTTEILQQVSAVLVTEEADVLPAAWHSLGVSLTSLAFPYACNNPTCSNLSGRQELQLVNGRSCMCGGCRVAHYCSRACQRQHWKAHKPVCQAIAAAQAAETESAAEAGAAAQAGS